MPISELLSTTSAAANRFRGNCPLCGVEEELTETAIDRLGISTQICYDCSENECSVCERCDTLVTNRSAVWASNGNYVYCPECSEITTNECHCCGDRFILEDLTYVEFHEDYVCDACLEDGYCTCDQCEEYVPIHNCTIVHGLRGDDYVCDYCREDNSDIIECQGCLELFYSNTVDMEWINGSMYCPRCARARQSQNDISGFSAPFGIASYSYKPRPLPVLTKEQKEQGIKLNDIPLYGFELEVEYTGTERWHDLDSDANYVNEFTKFTYVKHDGSLSNGMEIVSHPCSFEFLQSYREQFGLLFRGLVERGFKSHDVSTCGLHFHISSQPLIDKNPFAISNLITIVDVLWNPLLDFSRRTESQLGRWAKRYSATRGEMPMVNLTKGSKSCGRYMAVNLQNQNTVEIRMMRGTLHATSFIATFQLMKRLVDLSINLKSPVEAVRVTWDDILNCSKSEYAQLHAYSDLKVHNRQSKLLSDPSGIIGKTVTIMTNKYAFYGLKKWSLAKVVATSSECLHDVIVTADFLDVDANSYEAKSVGLKGLFLDSSEYLMGEHKKEDE